MVNLPGAAPHPEAPAEDFSIHHAVPLAHGGQAVEELPPLVVPPVDWLAARKPVSPGFPPLAHRPLPQPRSFQLIVPQLGMGAEAIGLLPDRPTVPAASAAAAGAQPTAAPVESILQPGLPPVAHIDEEHVTFVQRIDPLYAYLLYLALGFGTLYLGVLDVLSRYTVLWTALVGLGAFLTLVDARGHPRRGMASANLGWGVSFGLVFSLPLFILVGSGLSAMVKEMFPNVGPAVLFQSLVFVGALGETLFFRGVLQDQRGILISVLAAGASSVLFFWPTAAHAPVYLVAAVLFTTVLAGVYSFVRTRYGLAAAYVCQVTVNLMLLFVPSLL